MRCERKLYMPSPKTTYENIYCRMAFRVYDASSASTLAKTTADVAERLRLGVSPVEMRVYKSISHSWKPVRVRFELLPRNETFRLHVQRPGSAGDYAGTFVGTTLEATTVRQALRSLGLKLRIPPVSHRTTVRTPPPRKSSTRSILPTRAQTPPTRANTPRTRANPPPTRAKTPPTRAKTPPTRAKPPPTRAKTPPTRAKPPRTRGKTTPTRTRVR